MSVKRDHALEISTARVNPPGIQFIKGGEPVRLQKSTATQDGAENETVQKIRESLAEAMNAKNVSFLLGSGCSSYVAGEGNDKRQLGIPTMMPLAAEFTGQTGGRNDRLFLNATEKSVLKGSMGIDVETEPYNRNLEKLMEVLYGWKFTLNASEHTRHKNQLRTVERVLSKLKRFLYQRCTSGAFSGGDNTVQKLYEDFYRKLVFRDRSLPRPWVFSTNYDLFNETAMDRMGLPYSNGFSGTIERRFNPSVFRYALAEQLDLTNRKWSAVDGFVYLCKLHGSVSWIEDGEGLFPVRELQKSDGQHDALMIYPTPAKHAFSFSSPYSDLFREFQSHIVREQSVLFVLGYSFGDQHINNIIYQALTIPTFRVIIFADPDESGEIAKLRELKDSRIWIIGGSDPESGDRAHYFDYFVQNLMPELPGDQVDKALKKVISLMGRDTSSSDPSGAANDIG